MTSLVTRDAAFRAEQGVDLQTLAVRMRSAVARGDVLGLLACADALDHAAAWGQRDDITGCWGKRAGELVDRRHPPGAGEGVGVIFVDLDGLKALNDRDGHAAGDAYIRRAALVLKGVARAEDVVAREGGDEFVLYLMGPRGERDVATMAGRVSAALQGAGVQASVGWAHQRPAERVWETRARADRAMYAEKARHHARGYER